MRNPERIQSQEPVSTPNFLLRRIGVGAAFLALSVGGYKAVEWINEKEVVAIIDTAVEQGSNPVNTVCGATKEWAEENNINPKSVNGCVEAGQKAGKELTELHGRQYVYPGDGIRVEIKQTNFGKLRSTYIADASATE